MINSIRKLTLRWLAKHDCTVVAFWGANPLDLWQVLDIYANSELDGKGYGKEALEEEYPDCYEDIEIAHFCEEFGLFKTQRFQRFNNCKHKLVFLKDEVIQLDDQ